MILHATTSRRTQLRTAAAAVVVNEITAEQLNVDEQQI